MNNEKYLIKNRLDFLWFKQENQKIFSKVVAIEILKLEIKLLEINNQMRIDVDNKYLKHNNTRKIQVLKIIEILNMIKDYSKGYSVECFVKHNIVEPLNNTTREEFIEWLNISDFVIQKLKGFFIDNCFILDPFYVKDLIANKQIPSEEEIGYKGVPISKTYNLTHMFNEIKLTELKKKFEPRIEFLGWIYTYDDFVANVRILAMSYYILYGEN